MNGKHTPEPWEYIPKNMPSGPAICGQKTTILTAFSPYHDNDDILRHDADMRRIVACVNACAGIETEALENTHDLNVYYDDMIRQRDELLAAAKSTIRENLHLADGDCCTLYELKTAVLSVDPCWDMYADDEVRS